jgi:hypothetical protein
LAGRYPARCGVQDNKDLVIYFRDEAGAWTMSSPTPEEKRALASYVFGSLHSEQVISTVGAKGYEGLV